MELGYLCGRGGEGECGRREGLGFFVMFLLTMGVIFLNLLVATILTMSVKSLNLEERATSRYKLGNFIKLWNRYDEGGEGYINYKVFFQFSMAMAMECGIDKVPIFLTPETIPRSPPQKDVHAHPQHPSLRTPKNPLILLPVPRRGHLHVQSQPSVKII